MADPRHLRRLLAALMLLGGCGPSGMPGTLDATARVTLESRGGDVFARTQEVAGRASCPDLEVSVNHVASTEPLDWSGTRFTTTVDLGPGDNVVAASCRDGGRSDTILFRQRLQQDPALPIVPAGSRRVPPWARSAVMYGVVPPLWGPGGAESVRRKLPYLDRLGIDVLWLWPPVSLRASGEEYAIVDPFELDPSWGSEEELRQLIDAAHRRGLRVLVDFVPNHLSTAAPYYRDAETHGLASPYWDFFDRDPSGDVIHYFEWSHLPNLDYDNPEVRSMMIEASTSWLRRFDVDGFRMDVAWGVERRRPGFWARWIRELGRVDPDVLLLAEASARDESYFRNGFDVAYDWAGGLGVWAWERAFSSDHGTAQLLRPSLAEPAHGRGMVLRFLNNNDTGRRFADRYGPRLTKVAATLQFTVPGMPVLFAGDEIGAAYEPYSQLQAIPWRDRLRLRPHYERLIRLRHQHAALHGRRLELVAADDPNVLAYVRPAGDGEAPLLVVLNFGGATTVGLDGTGGVSGMRDLLSGEMIGSADVPMRSVSARVLIAPPHGGGST